MKKMMMIGLIMLVAAGAAFAQEVSVSGSAQFDIGVYDAPAAGPADWYWDFLDNGGTFIQVSAEAEKVTAWLRFRGSMHWMGDVTVDLDPVKLSIGRNRLPVAFWSSYELYGDEHFGIGASATNRATYVQAKVGDFFIGIADSNAAGFKVPNADPDKEDDAFSPNYLNGKSFADAFSPVFYLGYNYGTDQFSVGASFVGVYLSEDYISSNYKFFTDDFNVFSFMGNIHGKFLGIDSCTLGLNVSLYGSPAFGPFTLTSAVTGGFLSTNAKDALVLEALLDVSYGIEGFGDIGFGAGIVYNLAGEDKGGGGFGAKFGLSAIIDLGGGFSLVPGVALSIYNEEAGENLVDGGISFMYSF